MQLHKIIFFNPYYFVKLQTYFVFSKLKSVLKGLQFDRIAEIEKNYIYGASCNPPQGVHNEFFSIEGKLVEMH